MLFRHCNKVQLAMAVHEASELYDGNLKLVDVNAIGKSAVRARLGAVDSRKYGARTAASGRHGQFASWEAHRDFFRALFAINPDAVIVTSMAKYTAANFEGSYQATASINVASGMRFATLPSLSVGCRW